MVETAKPVKVKAPVVENPAKRVRRQGLDRQMEDDAVIFELLSKWVGQQVEIVCLNGDRWQGVLRAVAQYVVLVETENGDVLLFKSGFSSMVLK